MVRVRLLAGRVDGWKAVERSGRRVGEETNMHTHVFNGAVTKARKTKARRQKRADRSAQ